MCKINELALDIGNRNKFEFIISKFNFTSVSHTFVWLKNCRKHLRRTIQNGTHQFEIATLSRQRIERLV